MQIQTPLGIMELLENCAVCNIMVNTGRMFEEDLIRRLSFYIQNAKIITDIGAHIGCHTISYAQINNTCQVYSFEPQKKIFDVLNKNVLLKNVCVKASLVMFLFLTSL